jgi:hypothetical protein
MISSLVNINHVYLFQFLTFNTTNPMTNTTVLTAECAIDFVSQLDLPAASLSHVMESIANLNAWTTIGILVLWLLFPELAYYPGTPQYTASQQINW